VEECPQFLIAAGLRISPSTRVVHVSPEFIGGHRTRRHGALLDLKEGHETVTNS
jgi:hypothetical protein